MLKMMKYESMPYFLSMAQHVFQMFFEFLPSNLFNSQA